MERSSELLSRLTAEESLILAVFGNPRKKSQPVRKVSLRPVLLKGALPCPFQRIGSERQDATIPANAPGGVRTALPCRHGATGFGQAPCGNAGTCQRTVFALTQAKDAFTRHGATDGATAIRLFFNSVKSFNFYT